MGDEVLLDGALERINPPLDFLAVVYFYSSMDMVGARTKLWCGVGVGPSRHIGTCNGRAAAIFGSLRRRRGEAHELREVNLRRFWWGPRKIPKITQAANGVVKGFEVHVYIGIWAVSAAGR